MKSHNAIRGSRALQKLTQTIRQIWKQSSAKRFAHKRNRRLQPRFDLQSMHLMIKSGSELMSVRDISADGLCIRTSEQSYQTIEAGSDLKGHLRYKQQWLSIEATVKWKENHHIGLGTWLKNASYHCIFDQIIKPRQIAHSFKAMDSEFMRKANSNKTWYHGDYDSELYIWASDEHTIDAWQLVLGDRYIDWNRLNGLRSGKVQVKEQAFPFDDFSIPLSSADAVVDYQLFVFGQQVLKGLEIADRDQILATIKESS